MRTRFLLFCGVVLALCLWHLWWQHAKAPKPIASPETVAVSTNPPPAQSQPVNPPSAPPAVAGQPAPNVPAPAVAAVPAATGEVANARYQQMLALWQTPIEFYGKVIDENSNPVAGASIQFTWSEAPTNGSDRSWTTASDADGLFSLQDKRGPSLDVSVSKAGYYSSRQDKTGFSYGPLAPEAFSPSMLNPVIFHLRKKGAGEKLIEVKQNYGVARDGTPLGIDLTTGKAVAGGSGNLVVQCWTDDAGKSSGQKYDWHCLVSVPGGGLVLSSGEFDFSAPDEGYAPSTEIKMPADRTDWRNDVELKFFYRLADGRYGRMTFAMIAGGQHFCMVDSFLNPTGTRNLENDPGQ